MCGRRWIRTTEGISQQIYSLPHLATLVFALVLKSAAKICLKIRLPCVMCLLDGYFVVKQIDAC